MALSFHGLCCEVIFRLNIGLCIQTPLPSFPRGVFEKPWLSLFAVVEYWLKSMDAFSSDSRVGPMQYRCFHVLETFIDGGKTFIPNIPLIITHPV